MLSLFDNRDQSILSWLFFRICIASRLDDKTIMGKVIEDYNDRQLLKKIMMAPFVSIGGKRKTIKKIRK